MTSWRAGVSPIGMSSFGTALEAGRNRVPMPAAGITALRTCMGPTVSTGLARRHGRPPIAFLRSMPTYVYRFVDTGETIEVQQSFDDAALTEATHPTTGEVMPVRKVFTPVGVTFKGGGFYKTDSRGKSATERKKDETSSTSKESSESTSKESTSRSRSPRSRRRAGRRRRPTARTRPRRRRARGRD